LIELKTQKLLEVGLVELFLKEYLLAIMMLAKKDMLGNWIES
jgi:hypothetical protein